MMTIIFSSGTSQPLLHLSHTSKMWISLLHLLTIYADVLSAGGELSTTTTTWAPHQLASSSHYSQQQLPPRLEQQSPASAKGHLHSHSQRQSNNNLGKSLHLKRPFHFSRKITDQDGSYFTSLGPIGDSSLPSIGSWKNKHFEKEEEEKEEARVENIERLGRSRRRAVSGPSRRAIKGYYDTITPQPPTNSSATIDTFKHQHNHVSQERPELAFTKNRGRDHSPRHYDSQIGPVTMMSRSSDPGNWCVMSIAGNATIVLNRKDDFVNYFKMNVASLTGSQYDNVLVNSITYTPHLIVNSTLLDWAETGGRAIKVLTALSMHNDTLLDLSGVHFNVTHFAHSQTLMAPKPVAPYMTIGSGISLDNESNENGDGGLGGSGQITGTTNLRLLNTSIDTEKLEAVVFVVVGVAIAFLLTGSLFFAACQCIYRQKSMVVGQAHARGHSRSGSASLSLTATDEELMTMRANGAGGGVTRGARRSSTYSTSIRNPDTHSSGGHGGDNHSMVSLSSEYQQHRLATLESSAPVNVRGLGSTSRAGSRSGSRAGSRAGSVVSVNRKSSRAPSRMSSPVSMGLCSPGRSIGAAGSGQPLQEPPPHLIYSPDFSNSLKDPRLSAADEEVICLIGGGVGVGGGVHPGLVHQVPSNARDGVDLPSDLLYRLSHSRSNSTLTVQKRPRHCHTLNRRSLPGNGGAGGHNLLSRSRESLSSSSYNYTTSENSYTGGGGGGGSMKAQTMVRRREREAIPHHHHHHPQTHTYSRRHHHNNSFHQSGGHNGQPRRPASVAAAPSAAAGPALVSRNSSAAGVQVVQYRHRPPGGPHPAALSARRSDMVTFRNDLVPNKYEPFVGAGYSSDYVPWTDTEDDHRHRQIIGLHQHHPHHPVGPSAVAPAVPDPTAVGGLTTFRPTSAQLDIHNQPLSPSMITSPILIPPPSSPPGPSPVLTEGIGTMPARDSFPNCSPEVAPPPPVMTPEQIQADVDIILKTMGLSDDDCEELADPGAAPTPEATAASPPLATVAPPPSSNLTSGSALSSKATDESVSAVSPSTED